MRSTNLSVPDDDEHLKHGPIEELSKKISELLNETATTGLYPKEIKLGQLTPLQKPGKKAGPPSNLRPIILLTPAQNTSNHHDKTHIRENSNQNSSHTSSIPNRTQYH